MQALSGFNSSITHLDGRVINFRMESATPSTVKTIPGDGMPNTKAQSKGDLKIKFHIEFLIFLSQIGCRSVGFYHSTPNNEDRKVSFCSTNVEVRTNAGLPELSDYYSNKVAPDI